MARLLRAPNNAKAHYNVGSLALEKGRLKEARHAFERAIEIHPAYGAAYLNLGSTSLKLGKLDQAVQAYREAADLMLDLAQAHYNLGLALLKQGHLEQAVDAYERARVLDPDDPGILTSLGYAYAQQGKDEARSRPMSRRSPSGLIFLKLCTTKGRWLETQGRYREAVETYEKAVANGGVSVGLHQRIGRLYLEQLQNPQQAKNHWCQALNLASSPETIVSLRSEIKRLQDARGQPTATPPQQVCASFYKTGMSPLDK